MSTVSKISDWLTVRQAAKDIFKLTPQRVHQLIAAYGIETYHPSPRVILIKRADAVRISKKKRPTGVHKARQPGGVFVK